MDLQKCGWKSAYFFTEKQKRTKTDEKRILCKLTLIHVPAMILSNFDTKIDRAFKILVFTKSKEIRSNDIHVKQMMLNAIHVTLSIFSTSITP